MTPRTTVNISAEFHQIYVCDPTYDENWSDLWTKEAVVDRIVALEHTVVFGTGRNMLVPVDVLTHDAAPDITAVLSGADHAVSANIMCTGGTFIVAGCMDYLPDAFTLDIGRGSFGVAFLSFALGTIDGLDGYDRYELHIWPVTELLPPQVLLRFSV
jgi:hypothetical protein